jgi:AraC-like DNA-binding protein
MEVTSIAFHIGSLLLALLAAVLLLWVNQERKHSNRLLAFILILFAAQNLIHILLFSQLILKAPWLLRAFAPTTFLIGPVVFIYFRSVLNDEIRFKKYDWLLLIPGILTIINFIPYYNLPEIDKIKYLNDHFYNPKPNQDSGRGILPTTIYYILRVCWSGIFLFVSFRMISLFRQKNTPEVNVNNKILLNWLFTFNCILAAVWMVTLFNIFIPGISNMLPRVNNILFGATIFFICLQLFIRPQILYGVYQPLSKAYLSIENEHSPELLLEQSVRDFDTNNETLEKNRESALNISPEDQLKYKNLLENYFMEKKPFLQTEYSLEQLVKDIHVPRYILSALINREYGIGFRDFLNRYRVDYLKENLNNPSWKNLTLEAIGEQCGFHSRSTFINNFKRITGLTPSAYFKNKQEA